MKSTGEVMGVADTSARLCQGADRSRPDAARQGDIFLSVNDRDKEASRAGAHFVEMGFHWLPRMAPRRCWRPRACSRSARLQGQGGTSQRGGLIKGDRIR